MIILFTGFGVDGTNFYRVKTNVLKYLVDTPRDNTRGTRFTEISSLKEFETWTETVLLDVLFGSNTCETLLFSPDQVNKNCARLRFYWLHKNHFRFCHTFGFVFASEKIMDEVKAKIIKLFQEQYLVFVLL